MKNNASVIRPNIAINSFGNNHRNFVPQVVVIHRFNCTKWLLNCCYNPHKYMIEQHRAALGEYLDLHS